MADKPIRDLELASQITATDLFVLEQSNVAKCLKGQVLINWLVSYADGHGGIQTLEKTGTSGLVDTYTITYADETTSTFTVTNGKAIANIVEHWAVSSSSTVVPSTWQSTIPTLTDTNKYLWHYSTISYNVGAATDTTKGVVGVYGDTGLQTYVHFKWSAVANPTASDMGDIPDKYIGIYSGTSATAPTAPSSYAWYLYKGEKGDTGAQAEIEEAEIVYQSSTSGTQIPTGTWTAAIPTVPQGHFLWTRKTLTFNTGDPVVDYSVARMGMDGAGTVGSVNGQNPDLDGNVQLDAGGINVDDSAENPVTIAEALCTQSSQIGNLQTAEGQTRNMISDAWTQRTYAVGEYAIYNNKLWKCKVANSSAPIEGANWTEVSVAEEIESINFEQSGQATFNIDFGATADNIVYRKGNLVYVDVRTYNLTTTKSVLAGEAICTLPTWARPKSTIYIPLSAPTGSFKNDFTSMASVASNGGIGSMNSGSFYQFWANGVFII